MDLLISALKEYCQLNSLVLNVKKTNVVIFKKGGRNFKRDRFQFGEEDIMVVKRYVYLRVTFDSGAGMFEAATNIFNSANLAAAETRGLIWRAKLNNKKDIDRLFSSMVASVIHHASPVWAIRHLDLVERVQTGFYKKLLGLPQNTPDYVVRTDTGEMF